MASQISLDAKKVLIVIPARYDSSRLPGKPLADICGKPMIQRVYEQAIRVQGAYRVVIATDDERIRSAAESFGAECIMTSRLHASGTDRLVEVSQVIDADYYVNLQGDEPLVCPDSIELLINSLLNDEQVEVATLGHLIDSGEAKNPNNVKIVLSASNDALYFSRSLIPFPRDGEFAPYIKHIGVYAFKKQVLHSYNDLPESNIEGVEKLEQLRLLSAGRKIRVSIVAAAAPGVDTAEDLEVVRAIVSGCSIAPPNKLQPLKLIIADVDGVLTDGTLFYSESGECVKGFNVKDGLGIRLLQENGVAVAIVSGRGSPALLKRINDLGVRHFSLSVRDKYKACIDLMNELDLKQEEVAFIGDDSIDLPAFDACGVSFAVADAPEYIKAAATYVLGVAGGRGAVREVADRVLCAQNKSDAYTTVDGYRNLMDRMSQ